MHTPGQVCRRVNRSISLFLQLGNMRVAHFFTKKNFTPFFEVFLPITPAEKIF